MSLTTVSGTTARFSPPPTRGQPTYVEGTPIPLRFDYEDGKIEYATEDCESRIVYQGYRPQDSLSVHETFSKKGTYPFTFPSKSLYMLLAVTRQKLARYFVFPPFNPIAGSSLSRTE